MGEEVTLRALPLKVIGKTPNFFKDRAETVGCLSYRHGLNLGPERWGICGGGGGGVVGKFLRLNPNFVFQGDGIHICQEWGYKRQLATSNSSLLRWRAGEQQRECERGKGSKAGSLAVSHAPLSLVLKSHRLRSGSRAFQSYHTAQPSNTRFLRRRACSLEDNRRVGICRLSSNFLSRKSHYPVLKNS